MPCYTPLRIRRKIRHSSNDYAFESVPCGKCPSCLNQRTNGWVFRLMQEDRVHQSSLFITLTYAPESVPITKNGLMTLDKSDFQKFIKRIRKNTGRGNQIKYYAVGEYGGKTRRPHYHAIIFDVDEKDVIKAWSIDSKKLGDIHIGQLTEQSIAYCAKYVNKGKIIPMFKDDDRLPEFSLMSKGMGKNYIRPSTIRFHVEHTLKPYVVTKDGIIQSMPRYYKDKIFSEKAKLQIKAINSKLADDAYQQKVQEFGSEAEYIRERYYTLDNYLKAWRKNQNKREQI